jgi:hypothetical protein
MDIDYEQLAKAWYFDESDVARLDSDYWDDEWEDTSKSERDDIIEAVRRVVAALGEQGLVVVRREDVREARAIVSIYKDRTRLRSLTTECIALMGRLESALAAKETAG